MGAQTETELKEKKLRVEDALNATKVSFGVINLFVLPDLYLLHEEYFLLSHLGLF